jgi:hypothetical protein
MSSGIACGILLFTKANFFLVAVAFLGLSFLRRTTRTSRLMGAAIGFATVAVPVLGYLDFNVSALVNDLRFVAAARGAALSFSSPFEALWSDAARIIALLVLALSVDIVSQRTGRDGLIPINRITIALCASGAGAALLASNTQRWGNPLVEIAAVLLLNDLGIIPGDTTATHTTSTRESLLGVILVLGLVIQLPELKSDVIGFGRTLRHQIRHGAAGDVARIQAPGLDSLILESPRDVSAVNDGLQLLRKHSRDGERIVTFAFASVFPIALKRPPARGNSPWYCIDSNISKGRMLPVQDILGNADVLMVHKTQSEFERPTVDLLLERYAESIRSEFVLTAESDQWQLFRKRERSFSPVRN